ncbi:phage virion morphogenesis protein [Novosphingobium huizhouense]|uniref:phage virion morphogenesis protein n=1 Tax=Novosphingobium huizhouense TaxID=2866625 RepID=UPI001CD8CE4F|nr:phage virion morphogenesis protein [Novosphingobium huizhouense]
MEAPALERLEPWLAGYMARLEPRERGRLSRKIGKALRDANAQRIRDNVQPDGSPMEPRKPKADKRGRLRQRKGKMFPKTALARNLKVQTSAERIELAFTPLVAGTAAVHHYGLTAPVDPATPNSIKVRYPARRLLGFSPADIEAIERAVMDHVAG